MKTKEEILDKECNKHGGFVNVITRCGGTLVSQIWLRTMQEYSDQQTKELQEQLAQHKMQGSVDNNSILNLEGEIVGLKEQLAAKEVESESNEAIEFMNWVIKNEYFYNGKYWYKDFVKDKLTVEQLYEIFKRK